ncbi:enoyl-CoA hydratase/isomerase family protein [Luminiphilus sp.]|nr:enoyl-CoA hydratase/isomerase family protein [Luminiphilus sp.]MDA8619613.1 enoyl-CoA hydratase/isomerase family protein [Luminiphilus sp.]MDB2689051.1 enoyl-CoA hydratase/isomerase family protein [Luminiphilus sp.]MDC6471753.1 enoyl-CoA hydratase/isomerase family protein [Luminiphilus sp.]
MSDTISFRQQDGIATLSFDNPERRNALGSVELEAIEKALGALDDATRVLLITSSDDRVFCAGADLNQILDGSLDGDRFQSVTNQIAGLSVPTIAVLTGNVFGGGAELALSCDFRLGREDIVMRIPAAAIGLCYPVAGIERLTSRLGVSLARRLLVAAETFSADDMLTLGLVDRILPAAQLRAEAALYAESLLGLAPMAVTSMLTIIRQLEEGALDRKTAAGLANACSESQDVQEGILAQREKRAANFKNR